MPDAGGGARAQEVSAVSLTALALDLVGVARAAASRLVVIDATGDRLEPLAEAARAFDPTLPILVIPAWDSLPYDRSPPAAAVVGRRVASLAALASTPAQHSLIITSARAVHGRLQPPARWTDGALTVAPGDSIAVDEFAARLRELGYSADEHVDEPGQAAIRGHVIDIYPGDASAPVRLTLDEGIVTVIHEVDPVTQRSCNVLDVVAIYPVVEFDPTDADATAALVCLLDHVPGARVLLHPECTTRWTELQEAADDAHAATLRARRSDDEGPGHVPPPSQLFCAVESIEAALAKHDCRPLAELGQAEPIAPLFGAAALASAIRAAAGRVVLAATAGRVMEVLSRRPGLNLRAAVDWADAVGGPADTAAIVRLPLASGFRRDGLTVLAVPARGPARRSSSQLVVEEPPRLGDVVVHRDHGVSRLHGLVDVAGEERVALMFAEETELLVPASELDQLWRYGSEPGAIALDRVDGAAWRRRRDEIGLEITETARELAAAAAARALMAAPVIEAPATPYARFVRRFTFPLSPDQAEAIEATLADMAAGQPMDRLVCGDVGFGKTEVALRAAAAVALAGYQVAIVAPTTVLARQHTDTFERRFAGLGVRVAPLLRGAGGAAVRAGLADGSVHVVVGTQAVAAAGVRFKKLALVVIDEEQRFGDADKKKLTALRSAEGGVHSLVMTATPIPRTLQSAMVGLRQVSVIATPPVRRQPTRTFVLPWDPVVVREALMREHARGGQSFVVCPRIDDLQPTAARLAELTPELSMVTAHGRLKPEALEHMISAFAGGEHDVLLATNIIEAGLDIPRANTILITRPDRFGLAQLHQMRGRVGRGARRGSAYLLTEPGRTLAPSTERRLRTLAHQTQLGAGVAISLADMDARGAGELFGEQQAGHVHAIGTELYQAQLADALAAGRGEPLPPPRPDVHAEVAARIPDAMVPEPNLRIELYRKLARLTSVEAVDAFAEELDDRFGALPAEVDQLLDLARLRTWCASHGVTRLDAGPQAVALTLADPANATRVAKQVSIPAREKNGRVIIALAVPDPAERLQRVCGALLPG